jgi:hypothetical protein
VLNHRTDLSLFRDMESTETCNCSASAPAYYYHCLLYGLTPGAIFSAHHVSFHLLSLLSFRGSDRRDHTSRARVFDNCKLGTLCPASPSFIDHNSLHNSYIRSVFLVEHPLTSSHPFHKLAAFGGSLNLQGSYWVKIIKTRPEEHLTCCEHSIPFSFYCS